MTVAGGSPRTSRPGIGLDARPERLRGVVCCPGEVQVTVEADVHQRGPGGSYRTGRACAGHGGRGVEASEPVTRGEYLMPGQLVRAVENHRDAFGRVAVLVDVGRHRRDAGETEVEWLGKAPELGEKGQEESTHTCIDVTEDPPLLGQRGDVGDRVDHALGVRRRRADHHDRRVGAGSVEGVDVDAKVCGDRYPDQFDVEVVRRLGECGVCALGRDDLGVRDPAFFTRHVPGRLDGLQEALGAT